MSSYDSEDENSSYSEESSDQYEDSEDSYQNSGNKYHGQKVEAYRKENKCKNNFRPINFTQPRTRQQGDSTVSATPIRDEGDDKNYNNRRFLFDGRNQNSRQILEPEYLDPCSNINDIVPKLERVYVKPREKNKNKVRPVATEPSNQETRVSREREGRSVNINMSVSYVDYNRGIYYYQNSSYSQNYK